MPTTRAEKPRIPFPVVAFLTWLLATGSVFGAQPAADRNYVGINPMLPTDADGSNAFADLAIQAQRWMKDDGSDTVALDADGWPLADASTIVFGKGNRPGTYHLRFEGRADSIEVMWLAGRVDSLRWDPGTNISDAAIVMAAPMGETGGLILHGTRRTRTSAAGTGFRNLHLWRPGYPVDGSRLFTDEWEALMSRFDVVRFMDWGSTDRNPVGSWADRRRPGTANPGDKTVGERTGDPGLPLEYMVALCNRTGTDAWINVPVMADSTYVTNLVKLVLHGSDGRDPYANDQTEPVWEPLQPGLRLYLEHGDELWNILGSHDAVQWFHDQSEAMRVSGAAHPIFFDQQDDEWTTHYRWMGWRAAQMSLWARSVATDARMMARIRPVVESEFGDHASNAEILPFLETWYAAPRAGRVKNWRIRDLFWGAGGAIYSGSDVRGIAGWFDAASYPRGGFANAIAKDALLAGAYGLARVAYAGGPSLDSVPDNAMRDYLSAAGMADAMRRHQEIWSANGGDLAVYCCATGDPSRSFARVWDDSTAPKLLGIDAVRKDPTKSVVLGCVAPCEMRLDTMSYGFSQGDFWNMELSGVPAVWGVDSGEWFAVPVVAPRAGSWTLGVRAQSADGGALQILLADSVVARLDVPPSDTFQDLTPVPIDLGAGLSVFRIRGYGGECAVTRAKWTESGVGVARRPVGSERTIRLAMRRASILLSIPSDAEALQILSPDGAVVDRFETGDAAEVDLRALKPGLSIVRTLGGEATAVFRLLVL